MRPTNRLLNSKRFPSFHRLPNLDRLPNFKRLPILIEMPKITREVALAAGFLLVLSLIVGVGGLVASSAVEIFRSHTTQLIELAAG